MQFQSLTSGVLETIFQASRADTLCMRGSDESSEVQQGCVHWKAGLELGFQLCRFAFATVQHCPKLFKGVFLIFMVFLSFQVFLGFHRFPDFPRLFGSSLFSWFLMHFRNFRSSVRISGRTFKIKKTVHRKNEVPPPQII